VIVAGDAAGLLEPWTREGISFALRSGSGAGDAAAAGDLAAYERRVGEELAPEMAAGRRLLAIQMRRPMLIHAAMAMPVGWRAFEMFCRGRLAMASVIERPVIRSAVRLLGA
jgi:flavin-dependent dehydrogenase